MSRFIKNFLLRSSSPTHTSNSFAHNHVYYYVPMCFGVVDDDDNKKICALIKQHREDTTRQKCVYD